MAGSATGIGNVVEYNNNYYEFVAASHTWDDALSQAQASSFSWGINSYTQGDLVQINSSGENDFILNFALENNKPKIKESYHL